MARPSKYAPELRERAVRMVFDHAHEHPSQWATIRSVAEKIGCTVEATRRARPKDSTAQSSGLSVDVAQQFVIRCPTVALPESFEQEKQP
jgi:transposase-like protein